MVEIHVPTALQGRHHCCVTLFGNQDRNLCVLGVKNRTQPKQTSLPVETNTSVSGSDCSFQGRLQVSGEAAYTDDVKLSSDFLHCALVVSTKPYAKILSVDPTAALKVQLLIPTPLVPCSNSKQKKR